MLKEEALLNEVALRWCNLCLLNTRDTFFSRRDNFVFPQEFSSRKVRVACCGHGRKCGIYRLTGSYMRMSSRLQASWQAGRQAKRALHRNRDSLDEPADSQVGRQENAR